MKPQSRHTQGEGQATDAASSVFALFFFSVVCSLAFFRPVIIVMVLSFGEKYRLVNERVLQNSTFFSSIVAHD